MGKRKTIEEIRKDLSCDPEYEIVEPLEYISYKTSNIKMKHLKCGQVFNTSLDKWRNQKLRSHRCEYHKTTIRKTTEEFKNEVYEKDIEKDYEVIGNYINKRTKIEMKHISKNHNFLISPEDFLSGCRCNICYKTHLKTTEEFKEEMKKINPELEIVGTYEGANKKIKVLHTCGNYFFMKPNDLLNNHGCPKCYKSFNETKIAKILKENNEIFYEQYKFDDCLSDKKWKLKFDFYLPEKNTCIEYDGEYHFKDIHGDLKEQQRRDEIKNIYCKEHNIKLIRISYLEKDKINNLINLIND